MTTAEGREPFEEWGVVELMGRQRIAGRLTEEVRFGSAFLRVDVPPVGEISTHTKLFGSSAIYCVNITTEEVAKAVAANLREQPVSAYEIPALRQRSLPVFDGEQSPRCSACGEYASECVCDDIERF